VPYDPERDFIAASLTWELAERLRGCPPTIVRSRRWRNSSRGRSRKAKPVSAVLASGTSPHLSGVLFVQRTGLDAVARAVPRRGADHFPLFCRADVNFGDRQSRFLCPVFPVWQNAGAGGDLGAALADQCPTLPTMAEGKGLEGFRRHLNGRPSWCRTAPPRPIIDKIAAAMKQFAADPELQKRFLVAGSSASSPARRRRRLSTPPRSGRCGKTSLRCRGRRRTNPKILRWCGVIPSMTTRPSTESKKVRHERLTI